MTLLQLLVREIKLVRTGIEKAYEPTARRISFSLVFSFSFHRGVGLDETFERLGSLSLYDNTAELP